MTARVHDSRFHPVECCLFFRCKGDAIAFSDWKGIHIGAKGNYRTWFGSFKQTNYTCFGNPGLYFDTQ